jgi:bifunctional NMN adenylyltransferase/nudix hydrolase
MNKKYNYTVFIGRFQPYHRAHHAIVEEALNQSDKLIIVIGSHNGAPSLRNPFSASERVDIIKSALTEDQLSRVIFTFVSDHAYNNNLWIKDVQNSVSKAIDSQGWTPDAIKIALIGHSKDNSSFYLKMFPQYDSINVERSADLNATDIRNELYEDDSNVFMTSLKNPYFYLHIFVNKSHADKVIELVSTDKFKQIKDEYKFIQDYKKVWGENIQANTVDAVVTIGGHVLMIQRGNHPGKNQWALPGGFLNRNETIEDAMLRELREETKLTVPEPSLRGSIRARKTYDMIDRDPRGRIITHGFHIDMKHYGGDGSKKFIDLPKIKGSDDAKKAKWFTFSELESMKDQIYSDHYDIIEDLMD